tara:strand:- start:55 stop:285 length:231 start_codon:yes stop_codon:yes gene_type:complete
MQKETLSKPLKKKPSKWEKNKVGVFWTKKKSDGKEFLSGTINFDGKIIPICIFKNNFSDGNTPHFQAYKVVPSNEE